MLSVQEYKKYMLSLINFMVENGYTVTPAPKIILDYTEQENNPFMTTGYYDPEKKGIRLFVANRHCKDVLRTLAHELIHWAQEKKGIIAKTKYKGTRISEDDELNKLEKDAFLNGNIAFRKWTEEMQKQNQH